MEGNTAPDSHGEKAVTALDLEEYEFDSTTLNPGVILDILNGYKGNYIWHDVIGQFDFEVTIVDGVNAFIMEDEDGDVLRFYYDSQNFGQWTWRKNSSFEDAAE